MAIKYQVAIHAFGLPRTILPNGQIWEHGFEKHVWFDLKITANLNAAKALVNKMQFDTRVYIEGTTTQVYANNNPPYDNPCTFKKYLQELGL